MSNNSNDQAKSDPTRESPLFKISTKAAQHKILKAIFYKMRGARPERDKHLEAAYEKRFGVPMMDFLPTDRIAPVYLEGESGQGKTAAHRSAVREFALLMGMKFYDQVSVADVRNGLIDENCVIMSTFELGGATSNKEIAGLMAKVKIGDQELVAHLPDWKLAFLLVAGYGYALFDDFSAATSQVQSSALGILADGAAGDLVFSQLVNAKKSIDKDGSFVMECDDAKVFTAPRKVSSVYFGLAGNLGILDGSKTHTISNPIATRVDRAHVFDTLEHYAERTVINNHDATGDAFLCSFMKGHDDLFCKLAIKPVNGVQPQSPVSRSWDSFLTSLRITIFENGGVTKISAMPTEQRDRVLDEIEMCAGMSVGTEASDKLSSFYTNLFIGAVPLAEQVIYKGEVDVAAIEQKYNDGQGSTGQDFGHGYTEALAYFANAEISKLIGRNVTGNPVDDIADRESETAIAVRKILKHFSYGIQQFNNESMITFGVDQLIRKLSVSCPALFVGSHAAVPTPDAAMLIATGILLDNKKYMKQPCHGAIVDSLTSFSAVIGDEKSQDLLQKIKTLSLPGA